MSIHTYLPQDRWRALVRGETLPDRTTGSALFADISGFTALTETLVEHVGARRGTEELSRQVNAVYDALIGEIERYGGSVISFAGDAVICWFDGQLQETAVRSVDSARAMQSAMVQFPGLRLKVAIASGPARRFVVGDPAIQCLDALAGVTVTRTATGEHLAKPGDVLVDEETARAAGDELLISEWRTTEDSGERFGVLASAGSAQRATDSRPIPAVNDPESADTAMLRPYLLANIYQREISGRGSFLTEVRPCTVLFVRFTGIDYDSEQAHAQLDSFIRPLQAIFSRYEGALLQLNIGDKGSYVYANFGALNAHEDDARRAVKAALELRDETELQLQMGITQGLMRVGDYGGTTRKTFGALGDEVNLAARLMTTATAGEILLSAHAHKSVRDDFTFEPRPPLSMKGKAEPLPVFSVTGKRQQRAIRLQEPKYALPMVGRRQELQIINELLDLAADGRSQVVALVAEAGMGKSRLVAEVIRSARKKGYAGYGGACQSDGINTPYLAWKSIWQAFFDVDLDQPLRKQMRWLEGEIEDRAPTRVDAMPLLNVVLDLNIPENEFTQNLEPKIRQSALHALLEDCLKAAAQDEPLLIVIEDLHWIDALSHDLLEELAKALVNYPVCFVLAYRPPQIARLEAPRLEALPQFTRIELHELTEAEAESAIRAKLAQLYPARAGALPEGLVETLMARSQGNPFYLEELLNYVRDRGLDPADLSRIELPDSLHTLILSRIDRLSEQEQTTLRVASIVGRLFRARWLTGYYPELGTLPQVKDALDTLELLDITPLDTPEPELAYLFKHIVTHEVTYESLPFATRARLHEQLARYLEDTYTDALPLEVLAFHYGRSNNTEKQREYLRKAGEAAQRNYANYAALDSYGRLLPLLRDDKERVEIYLKRGKVQELLGELAEAENDYLSGLEFAKKDAAFKGSAQFALGKLNRLRGDYEPALAWLAQAQETYTALNDTDGVAQALIETGLVLWRKGENSQARVLLNEGLALMRQAGDTLGTAEALNNLGLVAWSQGDYTAARALQEESLSLRRKMGDKAGISASLHCLGLVVWSEGDYVAAREIFEESLSLKHEMDDKWGVANLLNNLGVVALEQGNYAEALALNEECLSQYREMGDKYGIALALNNLGMVAEAHGDYAEARALHEESLSLQHEIHDKRGISNSLNNLGDVALLQEKYDPARALYEECLALCQEIDEKTSMAHSLLGLGLVELAASQNSPEALDYILQSLHLRVEMGGQVPQTSCLIGIAGFALQEGDAIQAAQLLGAVDSALKTLNVVVEIIVKHFHAQTLAAVQDTLGTAAFQSAWEEGSQWSLEEAVKKVLQEEQK